MQFMNVEYEGRLWQQYIIFSVAENIMGKKEGNHMGNFRRVEVRTKEGQWREIEFKDLKQGDTFRMFESTGEQVIDENYGNPRAEFLAISDVYKDESTNQWMIKCEV